MIHKGCSHRAYIVIGEVFVGANCNRWFGENSGGAWKPEIDENAEIKVVGDTILFVPGHFHISCGQECPGSTNLTGKEIEILRLLCGGLEYKESQKSLEYLPMR